VLSYAVTPRTNEIGVRMALGATSTEILLSFGKRGLVMTIAGLGIGLLLAAIMARSMTGLLYGFRPKLCTNRHRRISRSHNGRGIGLFRSRAPRVTARSDAGAAT
jgi:ABC-type antimicrobial peptide transport system permease subunit